jgi:arylsulfatase A-like enzyme
MCSTTRAALLTGRNHHSVGVGCLANFFGNGPELWMGACKPIVTSSGSRKTQDRPRQDQARATRRLNATGLPQCATENGGL